jgi:hypothetical protein
MPLVREALKVKTYNVCLVGDDPFGALKSASVTVLGQLQRGLVAQSSKGASTGDTIERFYVFDLNWFDLGIVKLDSSTSELFLSAEKQSNPDAFVDCGLQSLGVFSLVLLTTSMFTIKWYDEVEARAMSRHHLSEPLEYTTSHKCLLLLPVNGEDNTFYRIGLATLDWWSWRKGLEVVLDVSRGSAAL